MLPTATKYIPIPLFPRKSAKREQNIVRQARLIYPHSQSSKVQIKQNLISIKNILDLFKINWMCSKLFDRFIWWLALQIYLLLFDITGIPPYAISTNTFPSYLIFWKNTRGRIRISWIDYYNPILCVPFFSSPKHHIMWKSFVLKRRLWCKIFGFFLLLFPQNERKMY